MNDQEAHLASHRAAPAADARRRRGARLFFVLFFWPGSGYIYDVLAAPLMSALPEGAKMIATGVITPFMVPVKVTRSPPS